MMKLQLSAQEMARMDLFGYLVFPGLLSDRIDRIIEEFEATRTRPRRDRACQPGCPNQFARNRHNDRNRLRLQCQQLLKNKQATSSAYSFF